jgi:hypothetical protein
MKRLIILVLSIAYSFFVSAQSDTSRVAKKDSTKYNFIVIDSRYQSQFAFWGRDYNQNLPFLATSLLHYWHSGVFISASDFLFFDQAIPTQLGLTLGYFKEVTPKVDWHISYSQFYVPDSSIPSAYKTQGYCQTTLGADWGPLFSSVQVHGLINNQSDIFFTTYHSRYFEVNKKLWKKVKVSFEPKLSFTMGTHHFEYANGLVIGPGGGGIITQPNSTEDAGDKIQPLNSDFLFPFKFEIGYFYFEPSWRYTLPFHVNPDYSEKGLHIFAVAMNYSIPLKK